MTASVRSKTLNALFLNFLSCLVFVVAGVVWEGGGVAMASTRTEFLVGAAATDITPDGSVALAGQMNTRIAQKVRSPITATALALESRENNMVIDQAILVSCDLGSLPQGILDQIRQDLKDRLTGFDVNKLLLSATHTHTGPVLKEGIYNIPEKGVIQPTDYVRFLTERLGDLIVKAWKARKPGAVSWGLGHAVVAQNRRAVYADGHVAMYGRTDVPNFRNMEGYEDHDVNVLFFWNQDKKLLAVAVNVACPAQKVENTSAIDADFWHEVREMLQQRYSRDLFVLGWIGAAGDQSPHLMYRKEAEERMRQFRGLTWCQEIGRRICQAVDEAYEGARKDIRTDVPLVHKVEQIRLPLRKVTDDELAYAKEQVKALSMDPHSKRMMVWHEDVVTRYQRQKSDMHYDIELHIIRLGEVVICTNPFELFTDFGIQIKARSRALQTFIIQLTGSGGYVPTEKAVRSGGYSAIIESNMVGPEGGQVLVEKTVERINDLWVETSF
jgi:hypothetical protein